MGGLVEGKSDPYAVLRVGTQLVTSRVVPNELNPTWDEVYEVRTPPQSVPPPPPCWCVTPPNKRWGAAGIPLSQPPRGCGVWGGFWVAPGGFGCGSTPRGPPRD